MATARTKNGAFPTFIGTHQFDGHGAELRYVVTNAHIDVHVDINGDKHAGFALHLDGVAAFSKHDLVL